MSQTFIFQDDTPYFYPRQSSTPWSERPIGPSVSPAPPIYPNILLETVEPAGSEPPAPAPAPEPTPEPAPSGSAGIYTSAYWRVESHRTAVLRIALARQNLWGKVTIKKFWESVAQAYQKATQQEQAHKTIPRVVGNWVRERQENLLLIETGGQDPQTDYTEAIDSWILVLTAAQSQKDEIRELQGRAEAETQESESWRERQLVVFSRKRQNESVSEEAGDNSDDEPSSDIDILSSPPPAVTSSKKKRRMVDYDSMIASSIEKIADHFATSKTSEDSSVSRLEASISNFDCRIKRIESGLDDILKLLKARSDE